MSEKNKSDYYPRIAPWKHGKSGGFIIHGIKEPEHQLIDDGYDPDRGDQKIVLAERYELRITMPKSSLDTRKLRVGLRSQSGKPLFPPFRYYIGPPGDPINLIVMDVVMRNGQTITSPITGPAGIKMSSDNLGTKTKAKITVTEGTTVTELNLTRIPNPVGGKPLQFDVESDIAFSPRRGHEDIDYHYIENTSRNITVVMHWHDNGKDFDTCEVWVYTNQNANVVFT